MNRGIGGTFSPTGSAEFRSAVLLDGDTVQRVLESFVGEYVEQAKQGG